MEEKGPQETSNFARCQRCNQENIPLDPRKVYIKKYCPECYKEVLRENLKISKEKGKIKKENLKKGINGSQEEIRFLTDNERFFYEERKKQYLKDFDFCDSADLGLLSRLLSLELESKRIESLLGKDLSSEQRVKTAKTLAIVVKSIREVQKSLGILRSTREQEQKEDIPGIIEEAIQRYRKYKKEHPEQFSWRCSNCGAINYPNRRIPQKDVGKGGLSHEGNTGKN